MNELFDLINSPEVNMVGATHKLLLSLVLGAAVGMERKHKGQKAGMRTFALISMGATLAMLISIYIPQVYMGLKNGDPGRIAAQVVSGVGFLGAGAIIQSKGSVKGLTTAAGIWMTAMIGLAVGAGMYLIATIATGMIIFILMGLERVEKKLKFSGEAKIIRLKLGGLVDDITPYKSVLELNDVHVSDNYIRYDYTAPYTLINFMIRAKDNTNFLLIFEQLGRLSKNTQSITLSDEVDN